MAPDRHRGRGRAFAGEGARAGGVGGGCSLRGGEGTIVGVLIGSSIMRVLDNGINMFKWTRASAGGELDIWRLDENWRNIIIGAVILGAVILDQVTHWVQDRRRRRRVE